MIKIIVIDGYEEQGRSTQAKLLEKYLLDKGNKVYYLEFPFRGSDSSILAMKYLNGDFGKNINNIDPVIASTLFAVDRGLVFMTSSKEILENTEQNKYIICNRFISSNIIYQGAKYSSKFEKIKFFKWVYEFENNVYNTPIEDLTICLDSSVDIPRSLKDGGTEDDFKYKQSCRETMRLACKELPKLGYKWTLIDCTPQGVLLSDEEVFKQILRRLEDNAISI